MPAVAFIVLLVGGWLVSSAVKNRGPVETLLNIVQNPSDAKNQLANAGQLTVPSATAAPTNTVGGLFLNGLTGNTSPANASGAAGSAIQYARQQIGKPYRWGATGPDAFDCSGLIWKAYQQAGVFNGVRQTTQTLILRGSRVDRASLQPGDLVFPDLGHVQLYSGNGMVIEAPTAGKNVREVPMWGFLTARRIA